MAIQSKLTIEDYIKNANGRSKVIRQDLKPQKETQTTSTSTFNGILSTFKKPSGESEIKTAKGLSVADYRSHPVASFKRPLARQLPANTDTGTQSTFKEASEYLLGPENQQLSVPFSKASAVDKQIQKKSPLNSGDSLGAISNSCISSLSPTRSGIANPKIEQAIQDAAVQYQLSPKLIKGVIQAESNYDPNAVSPAGAQGLMQLMPGTARDLGVTNPFDIKQNVDGGVRYLRKMMDMFGGNIRKALSAYNAGPATVKRYNGDVPYSETRQYVEKVMNSTKTVA